MVSEPQLWPFLSSLVFIGVTPLSIASAITTVASRRWTSDIFHRCLWVPDLQLLSLRSPTPHRSLHMSFRRDYCSDQISGDITEIVLKQSTRRWKPCPHRSCHALSHAAWIFCANAPRAPRATRAVQSSSWRHLWRHLLHVSPSCVSIRHLLTSAPRHLGDVICWPLTALTVDRWLWLTVDFLPELTFAVQVLLTQFFA